MKIAFVCYANMSRSPVMHAIFQQLVNEAGMQERFYVDSFAIASHSRGHSISPVMAKLLNEHGYHFTHLSQPLLQDHIDLFDVIVVATEEMKELLEERGAKGKVRLLQGEDIPNPHGGAYEGFEKVFAYIEQSCRAFFNELV